VAGDDATEARFVPFVEAMGLVGWDETRRVIALAFEHFRAFGLTPPRRTGLSPQTIV